MKFMETINEMQALVTKLRREVQRSEAPKLGFHVKTAGECSCPPTTLYPPSGMANEPVSIDVDCPVHGKNTWTKTAGYSPAIDPHRCFVCGIPAVMGFGNPIGSQIGYCRKHMPQTATGMPRQCTCVSGVVGDDCPVHGTAGECTKCTKIEAILEERIHGNMPDCRCGICMRVVDVIWPDKEPNLTPDPLRVRVAKANGRKNIRFYNSGYRRDLAGKSGNWIMDSSDGYDYEIIPDYPNDLVAAMGALEEYCRKHKITWHSEGCYLDEYRQNWNGYFVKIEHRGKWYQTENLPQAICEAIVAHAEEK